MNRGVIKKIYRTKDIENIQSKINMLGNNRKFVDALPPPLDYAGYSDSKNIQYLIIGNGIFNLGQSYFNYQDDRKEVMHYSVDDFYEEDYIRIINNKVNALRYVKAEKDNTLDLYKVIDVKTLKEVYCNDDWYAITYKDGTTEIFNCSFDSRAELELKSKYKEKSKIMTKSTR